MNQTMSTKERFTLIILSFLALLNAIKSPIFNIGYKGGLFPSSYDTYEDILDIMEELRYLDAGVEYWITAAIIPFAVVILVSAVFMLIGAILGWKKFYVCVIGLADAFLILLLGVYAYLYTLEYKRPFYRLFDVEKGDVAIGIWIAIALLHISTFVVKRFSKHNETSALEIKGQYKSNEFDISNQKASHFYIGGNNEQKDNRWMM